MKLMSLTALPALALVASAALAQTHPQIAVFACHVNFAAQEHGKPEHRGRSELYVTVSLEPAANGAQRLIASDPGSVVSFDTLRATSAGLSTPRGTFRDVSTSGSWTLNRSLRRADAQEFEEVIINRVSGELFYQQQLMDGHGVVLDTKSAYGPCVPVVHGLLVNTSSR